MLTYSQKILILKKYIEAAKTEEQNKVDKVWAGSNDGSREMARQLGSVYYELDEMLKDFELKHKFKDDPCITFSQSYLR